MFGELSLDDLVLDEPIQSCGNISMLEEYGYVTFDTKLNSYMVRFLILIYILITNAVLMNVLTASVFNKTLNAEKEKTKVWLFYRIALVQEFHRRSIIPP